MSQSDISARNQAFWDELCGSQLAASLNITDATPASLKRFDDWYFDYYPYLYKHIPFSELRGKSVLEVGLGYGSVSQKLAESGAIYSGLDIAAGPVAMVCHRLQQNGLSGHATQGSILAPPFSANSFDAVVAIGCLHHTGDLQTAIDRCRTILRPGGRLIFMVYYAYSYRRVRMASSTTLSYFLREISGYRGVVGISAALERSAYDTNSQGAGAPHTDWISVRSLRMLCRQFSSFEAVLENIDQEPPFSRSSRTELLRTRWPHVMGLDIYASATK